MERDITKLNYDELQSKLHDFITHGEAELFKVNNEEYDDARKYYEHDQKPADVPADKEYIEENLLTDMVARLIGGMVGGKFSPILRGGGSSAEAVRELFLDILEENKFQESTVESLTNYFYVEGYSGIKVNFNPFRRSKYGLGFPEIYALRPDSLILDNNSIDLKHSDDLYRIHKVKLPLELAIERYPKFEDKISASQEGRNDSDTEDFCDLYEVQIKRTKVFENEDKLSEERDEFYIARVINKIVLVKRENDEKFLQKSRFKRFSLIPLFHTPRSNTYKYPMGPIYRLKDTQDQLNITSSVILDAVKASIKMPVIITGASKEDEAAVRLNATKPDGVAFLKSPQAKVNQIFASPLVRPVVEWYQMTRQRFRDISGKYQPDSGEQLGQQSGKAIALLTFRGDLPEFVSKSHIEEALTEMGWLLFECIQGKMLQPFSIDRKIDGNDSNISFNETANRVLNIDGKYNVEQDGMVNKLSNLPVDSMKFSMEVEMNLLAQQEMEMNKAILMRNGQALSLKDYMRIMYPYTWKEKLENVMQENKVLGLVQQIAEVSPELLDNVMNQMQDFLKLSEGTGEQK